MLKKRIAQLRRAGQTELVFLVDSSVSAGSDNFYNEIKFIRKVRKIQLRKMNITPLAVLGVKWPFSKGRGG